MIRKSVKKKKVGAPRKDPPGLYRWPLAQKFWDFRAVNSKDVRLVAFYEYAASCDWIRKLWKDWTAQPFPSWKRIWFSEEFSKLQWDTANIQSVAVVLRKLIKTGINPTDSDEVIQQLLATVPEQFKNNGLDMILYAAPDFPTPWLKLDPSSKQRLKSRWNRICRKTEAFKVFQPREPVAIYRADPAYENTIFDVSIDWSNSEPEIVASFQRWLSKAYSQYGKQAEGKQKHSDGYQLLRWLSAWRLHRSGLLHPEAKEVLIRQSGKRSSEQDGHDLPIVNWGTWNNFLSRARHISESLFPDPGGAFVTVADNHQADFGLPSSSSQ